MKMNRRTHLKLVATAAGAVALGSPLATAAQPSMKTKTVKLPKYKNADFYDASGKFLPEKARAAYFDMMKRHGYDMHVEHAKKWATDFWVTDFGLGDFINVGMGGVFWINSQEHNYFAHEIYLLPGQMIVEHAHVETAKAKPKMESWHVRHGSVYCFGETGGEIPAGVKLPQSQENYLTVRRCTEVVAGDLLTLNRPTAKHFMMGGPSGGIVSEYASFHDNDGLRFTNPKVKF